MTELTSQSEKTEETKTPIISFSDAVISLKKFSVQSSKDASTLYANNADQDPKRRYDQGDDRPYKRRTQLEDMKEKTKFMACGKLGHSFKDRHECLKRMQEKLSSSNDNETNDPNIKSIFRRRGQ